MNLASWLFALSIITNGCLAVLRGYFIVLLTDLEQDYLNPVDLSAKLNPMVIPEALIPFILSVLYLFTGQFLAALVTLPVVAWSVHRYNRQLLYFDATDVFRSVGERKRESSARMAYHMALFAFCVYKFVSTLIYSSPTVNFNI